MVTKCNDHNVQEKGKPDDGKTTEDKIWGEATTTKINRVGPKTGSKGLGRKWDGEKDRKGLNSKKQRRQRRLRWPCRGKETNTGHSQGRGDWGRGPSYGWSRRFGSRLKKGGGGGGGGVCCDRGFPRNWGLKMAGVGKPRGSHLDAQLEGVKNYATGKKPKGEIKNRP